MKIRLWQEQKSLRKMQERAFSEENKESSVEKQATSKSNNLVLSYHQSSQTGVKHGTDLT